MISVQMGRASVPPYPFSRILVAGVKSHPDAACQVGGVACKPGVRVIVRSACLASARRLEPQGGDSARSASGLADLLENGGGDIGRALGINGAPALGNGKAWLSFGTVMWSMMYGVGRTPPLAKHTIGARHVQGGGFPGAQEQGRSLGDVSMEPGQLGGLDDVAQPGPVADAHGHGVAGKNEAEGGGFPCPR